MQYLLLIYEAEEIWESKSDDEKRAVLADHGLLNEQLQADGITYSGRPLMPTATAVSLRKRGGELQVSDGPFAETKEQLAGFYLVDVDSLEKAMKGEDPFEWQPELGTKIIAIPRDGVSEQIVFETDPFFSWHYCNGFEEGGKIIIDYIWISSIPFTQAQGTGVEKQPRRMYRMTLDPKTKQVTNEQFSDVFCEFSRVDERLMGKKYRYGFAASSDREWGDAHGYNCTGRYDFETGETTLWNFGDEANAGEPAYVPNPESAREEDGWITNFVYNPGEGAFLSLISAGNFEAGPVCKVRIPGRVPNGFHGNWCQDLAL